VEWALSDTRGRYGRPRILGAASFDSQSITALVATTHSHAVVAWVHNVPGHRPPAVSERVEIAEFAGNGFGRVRDAPGRAGVDPQLAAAGGEVLLAWRGGFGDTDMSQGSGSVYVASQAAGRSSFAPARTVSECACDQLRLAASSTGRAILAFEDLGPLDGSGAPVSPNSAVKVSLREPGGAFSVPSAAPTGDSLVVGVDATGTATMAWIAQATLYAAQAPLSQPFGAPVGVTSASAPVMIPGICPPLCPGGTLAHVSQPNVVSLGSHTLLTWRLPPSSAEQQVPRPGPIPHHYQGAIAPS